MRKILVVVASALLWDNAAVAQTSRDADSSTGYLVMQSVPVSRIDEQAVYNLRGQLIGEVESVRLGLDGQPYAVVAFDESRFFGLGGTHRLVPLRQMYFAGNRMILPGVSKAEAESMGEWNQRLGYSELPFTYFLPVRVWQRSVADTGTRGQTQPRSRSSGFRQPMSGSDGSATEAKSFFTRWTYRDLDGDGNLEVVDRQ